MAKNSSPPAPRSIYAWSENAYINNWSEYLCCFVRSHAVTMQVLPPLMDKPVNSYETSDLVKVQGRR